MFDIKKTRNRKKNVVINSEDHDLFHEIHLNYQLQ